MSLEKMVDKLTSRYVITTAQYNTGVMKKLLLGIEKYASVNNAEVLILPTTGKNVTEDPILASPLEKYKIITKDYSINNNLKIKDFGARPQQINPLTGLERFAQGDKSYIMPGTKQVLKYVANSYDVIPKAIMTTGAVTKPNYNTKHRIGRIAEGDHEYGFVVVEKVNSKYFHFRHVKALKNGKFVDKGMLYDGSNEPLFVPAKALVVGDLHPYDIDKIHQKVTMDQIKQLQPQTLFLHDTFNGKSISHHYNGRNIRKYEVFVEQGLNLEKELLQTAKEITKYANAMGDKPVYIVASNHDEHLFRYLDEGRFVGDKGNDLLGATLYAATLKGKNPLEYALKELIGIPENVIFLDRDQDLKIGGYQLANHGDLGANGGRGSPRSIENANGKSITAHGHSAMKIRNTYKVGTSTRLRLDYNKGYSNWTQTNAVIDAINTVQLYNTINGKWYGNKK